ncbi:MAG: indolepyruvate ferredoxin oxidoreductase subunit alpha, partial [Thermoplasmata archaeon]
MLGKPGEKVLLMGNEAIARGAIEAGLDLAASYPGTPSSEIGTTLAKLSEKFGYYFEYSANEKVAMEVALAAAVSGLYSMTMMKHVGLNVASDTLLTLAYTGVKGAMVIVSADDPSCHSSQNEQDNRYYGLLANLPVLEPATPQECLDFTRYAFELSHALELPVILRTTTRVNHTSADVVLGEVG